MALCQTGCRSDTNLQKHLIGLHPRTNKLIALPDLVVSMVSNNVAAASQFFERSTFLSPLTDSAVDKSHRKTWQASHSAACQAVRQPKGPSRRKVKAALVKTQGTLLDRHWPDAGCGKRASQGILCLRPLVDGKQEKCQPCVERGRVCNCAWL